MRTVLLSGVLAASLVAGCAASSPTAAPPSASAPPASSAPVTAAPAATPAPTLPAAEPTPDSFISADEASPAMGTLEAVLATLPTLAGQKTRERSCEEMEPEIQLEDGQVYMCLHSMSESRAADARQVVVDVTVYADAEDARSSFESTYTPPGAKMQNAKVLAAPALGEARQMIRTGSIGCEHYITILEGNAVIGIWFGGFGTVSPRTGKCQSWGSPPMAYMKRVYSKIADVLGTP